MLTQTMGGSSSRARKPTLVKTRMVRRRKLKENPVPPRVVHQAGSMVLEQVVLVVVDAHGVC